MEKYKFKQHSAAASNKLGAQVKITGYDWLYDGTKALLPHSENV